MRIVTFHGIGSPLQPVDAAESRYWIGRDRFRDILDRIAASPCRDRIAITFDDGNRSDVDAAVPDLRERGMTATFFVLTGRFDAPGYLDRADVSALLKEGMDIGSHGIDHVDWSSLSSGELTRELEESRRELEAIRGARVPASIPFGRYDGSVLRSLRRTGYQRAYSSDGGDADIRSFLRPRTSIRHAMSDAELDTLINGTVPVHRRVRRSLSMMRRRLI